MRARLPKHFVLEEHLERYADAIEVSAPSWRGNWAEACWPLTSGSSHHAFDRVCLDLGCGKGPFLAEMARCHPKTLFVGMDNEPICIAYAAQLICEHGLRNAVVVPGTAARLGEIFASGELSAIYINFPTPFPKRRDASKRIVTAAHLERYRPLLTRDGTLTLRTDSRPLFDYAIPQITTAGWRTLWTSDDDRADHPDTPFSGYERRLSAQGAKVNAVCAVPGPAPSAEQLTDALELPQSLYEYLPDNLFEGSYIPHGMSYGIVNLRNQRTHNQMRAH